MKLEGKHYKSGVEQEKVNEFSQEHECSLNHAMLEPILVALDRKSDGIHSSSAEHHNCGDNNGSSPDGLFGGAL